MIKLSIFLFALALPVLASAQDSAIPVHPQLPPSLPKTVSVPSNAIRNHVRVPMTKAEEIEIQRTGKIIWKRVYRPLQPNGFNRKRILVWIENFTHPIEDGLHQRLPEGYAYDPRGVRVTDRYLLFYAPAGDLIFYVVASR